MKAFRNNGIEGGYGNLRVQNWLLGLRKSDLRHARVTGEKASGRHSTSKSLGPAVKELPKLKSQLGLHWARPSLIKYDAWKGDPIKFGSTPVNKYLLCEGLIELVDSAVRVLHAGTHNEQSFGDTYRITKFGREYVRAMRANPHPSQAH